MASFTFDYDRKTDYLEVTSSNYEEQEYRESVNMGEISVNISHQNKIMSIEVMNASQIFNLPPEELERLDTASIGLEHRGDYIAVHVSVSYKEKESTYGIQVDA
ncbi:MAG: DUF2283 domain-containing protein, partial [Candidatus Nanohaloarchaea archaeon]|nr:DUF2283 domain-containing protein [Candidatus Nanohaloarchaea archaeon]